MGYDDAMVDEISHHSGSNGTELVTPLFGHGPDEYENILAYSCPDNLQKNICSDKACQGFQLCHAYHKKSEVVFQLIALSSNLVQTCPFVGLYHDPGYHIDATCISIRKESRVSHCSVRVDQHQYDW